jgi:hypothetical protein
MTARVARLLLAFGVVASGCSTTTRPQAPRSLTPRVTTGTAASRLDAVLLSTADLVAVPGAPSDLRAVPVNDAALFKDPDPRTPCGGHLAQPDLSTGAGVALQSSSISGFEFVFAQPVEQAQRYVATVQADTRPGCPTYQTRTNTGSFQTVRIVGVLALPKLADQQTGAMVHITNQGLDLYAAEVAVRSGGLLAIEVLLSSAALAPDFVAAVTAKAAARLHSGPAGS